MISKFMSWNGFPANVRFLIIRKLKAKYEVNSSVDCNTTLMKYHLKMILLMILDLQFG